LPPSLAARRLLRRSDVLEYVPTGARTLNRWMLERGFPRPRRIGGAWVWCPAEIAAWIHSVPRGEGIQPPAAPDTSRLERLLDIHQLRALVPVSRSTIHRRMRAGRFPAPLRIGDAEGSAAAPTYLWIASEILAWADSLPRVEIPEPETMRPDAPNDTDDTT
jgi:predicted DNA-binding transcriptional regulator AlpA